jgi:phospholipid/cholesterol/gamma-HCH transport system substrate-binding protein
MSKPANKTLIGIFVLGAITLLVIAVVVLGSGKFFKKTFKAVCFFEGSVGGLSVGAPVVFNGVRIGEVTDIILRYNTTDLTTTIPVYIEVDPQRMTILGPRPTSFQENLRLLIDHGLRARLELESIVTGKLQVSLGFYPDRPVKLAGGNQKYPEIPTIPSTVQEITKRIEQLPLEEMVKNIATAAEGINRIINSPEITKTIQSVSLAAEEARSLIQNLNSQVQPRSSDVQQTLREAQKVLRDIDVDAATLTSSVDGTVKDVQKLVQNVDRQVGPLGPSIQRTLASIEKTSDEAGMTLRQARQTLTALEGDIGEDSELMYELEKTVKEVGAAGKAIQSLANTLERQPESLLFGRKKITGR